MGVLSTDIVMAPWFSSYTVWCLYFAGLKFQNNFAKTLDTPTRVGATRYAHRHDSMGNVQVSTNSIAVGDFSASCQTRQLLRLQQRCVITTFIRYLQHILDLPPCYWTRLGTRTRGCSREQFAVGGVSKFLLK